MTERHLYIIPPDAGVLVESWCRARHVNPDAWQDACDQMDEQRRRRRDVLVMIHRVGDPRDAGFAYPWNHVYLVDMLPTDPRLGPTEHALVTNLVGNTQAHVVLSPDTQRVHAAAPKVAEKPAPPPPPSSDVLFAWTNPSDAKRSLQLETRGSRVVLTTRGVEPVGDYNADSEEEYELPNDAVLRLAHALLTALKR